MTDQKQYSNHVIPNSYQTPNMVVDDSSGIPLAHAANAILQRWFNEAMVYHQSIYAAILCEGEDDRESLRKVAKRVSTSDNIHLLHDDKCVAHTTLSAIVKAKGKSAKKYRAYPPGYGYVYLLRSPTNAYKIGRSKEPYNRLKIFEVKLPFEVEYIALIETPDMAGLERQLHERFAVKRIRGEWFKLSTEDIEYIKGLSK